MCYTEEDCSASALLHGRSGQADGNFVRKGADVASISVPMYFFQKILSLLGEENLDLIVGNKIGIALWCRTPLCRGSGGFLLNAVFLGLVAGVTTFSLNVFLGSTSCETMRCSGRSSQGCIEPSGCLGAHGETHRSGYLQPFCSHWCQVFVLETGGLHFCRLS